MLRLATTISLALLLIPAAACRQESRSVESAPPPASATTTPLQQAPPANAAASSPAERTPDEVVTELGRCMKQVSLLAPDAGRTLRKNYEGLVEPALLDQWVATPSAAPGRIVSSPWPDRIEIARSTQSGADVSVEGVIVEATSTGDAGRVPVEIQLRETDGSWLVSSYRANDRAEREPQRTDDAQAAVAVIRDYYDAIASRDFARAYAAWGSTGPRGQSLQAFAAGFEDTKSVRATTGRPSQIGAAAGSRYIDVPVTIVATTVGGDTRNFGGTYTLRRAVVDGASPADRRWHIDHASIRRLD